MKVFSLAAAILALILALAGSAGMQPLSPPRIVRVPVPAGISCERDPKISFAVPKPGHREARANAFDTPETVRQIRVHNAIVARAFP